MMRVLTAAALLLALGACGGSNAADAGPTPISHDPLTGKVNGAAWTAGMATAQDQGAGDGTLFVTVFEQGIDAGCNSFAASGSPKLLTSVPWVANSAYALSLQHNFTFAYQDSTGQDQNDVATSGRIELDAAPTAPDGGTASTTLRMRGEFNADNSVEGQVNVLVCPPF